MNTAPILLLRAARRLAGGWLALGLATGAFAQNLVSIESGWARASVQGQKASGAFMKLTAPKATRLVAVSSPVAAVSAVHEMKMDGDVMRMRAVAALDLPAGKTVELTPGGYHVMLQDLKMPLAVGATVPLTLTFRDAAGAETRQIVNLPVSLTPPPGGTAPMAMDGMKGMKGMGEHKP